MAKKTSRNVQNAPVSAPAVSWWIPVGIAVCMRQEPLTGHQSEAQAAVRETYHAIAPIIREALQAAGWAVTDLDIDKPYIGGASGMEIPFFPAPLPDSQPEPVDYSSWKVAELKAECEQQGLSTSGNRGALIARLSDK